jgi:cytochrome c551/c552
MKVIFIVFFIIAAFLNISCSNDNKDNQPAQGNAGGVQNNQSNSFADPVNHSKSNSKYDYPDDNGIGPVKEVSLRTIDMKLAAKGEKTFKTICIQCHQLDSRLVGPPLRNITKKNTPVFIMNYLLNTTQMLREDALMQKLVDEYKIIMPDQQLTKDDARALLEYFRSTEN